MLPVHPSLLGGKVTSVCNQSCSQSSWDDLSFCQCCSTSKYFLVVIQPSTNTPVSIQMVERQLPSDEHGQANVSQPVCYCCIRLAPSRSCMGPWVHHGTHGSTVSLALLQGRAAEHRWRNITAVVWSQERLRKWRAFSYLTALVIHHALLCSLFYLNTRNKQLKN